MNRHSVRLLVAALAATGLAGCFDDPTSSLREGPVALDVSRSAMAVTNGDSVQIDAYVRDAQGNPIPATGAVWTTDDATVAEVNLAAVQPPGDGSTRAYVKAKDPDGAVTYVRVTVRGLTDSVRVTSLPGTLPAGLASVTGTPQADTLLGVAYTAGDTVVITSGPTLQFDSANTAIRFGTNPAYIISRGTHEFRVMSRGPYEGPVTVTRVTFLGTATTGAILFDSLFTSDVVQVARARFRGNVAIGASAFGAGTQITVDAPAGVTFTTTGANATTVNLGSTAAIILTRTTSQITAISGAAFTGNPRINRAVANGVILDSLYTPAPITIGAAYFPGTVTGSGVMSDVVTVSAGSAAFNTAAATLSQVVINGQTAFVISRSATTMTVVGKLGGTAPVTVTNVLVGTTNIPQLSTSTPYAVNTDNTGEADEPANDTPGGAAINLTGSTSAAPAVKYGSLDDANDIEDFFTFTLATNDTVTTRLEFMGSGAGGSANPDLDLYACNAACSAFVGGFGGGTAAQPENLTLLNIPAATYHIYLYGYDTGGGTFTYKLSAYNN